MAMFRRKPLNDEPSQEEWLSMPLSHRAYWLLKMIDHYRDSNPINPEPRTKYSYQKGTCLVNNTSIDHHNDEVITAVDHGFVWLHNNGYFREAVGQSSGFYQITTMGLDVICLKISPEQGIDELFDFANRKSGLPTYDVKDVDILGFFVSGMERTGKNENMYPLFIDECMALKLSKHTEKNITVESLKKAVDKCLARRWVKKKYGNSGTYENLIITPTGISHYDKNKEATMPNESQPAGQDNNEKSTVFIVHGHDSALKNEVAVFLSELGLTHKILSNEANSGRTVIEKFEGVAGNPATTFAVLLFTADDEGKALSDSELQKRARQNVVFEAGYFFGKLGRDRTAIFVDSEIELPSDLNGMVYTVTDNWKMDLTKELTAAGLKITIG